MNKTQKKAYERDQLIRRLEGEYLGAYNQANSISFREYCRRFHGVVLRKPYRTKRRIEQEKFEAVLSRTHLAAIGREYLKELEDEAVKQSEPEERQRLEWLIKVTRENLEKLEQEQDHQQ